VKRYIEPNRRTWKVWFMDASKQGISSGLLHTLNLTAAHILGGMSSETNACTLYFLNYLIDAFLGMAVCYMLLKALENWFNKSPDLSFKSGFYGEPASWKPWAYQVWLWIVIVVLMKGVCVASIFIFNRPLSFFGEVMLSPFAIDPKFELIMIMIVIPTFCNSLIFWVTDNFLKFDAKNADITEAVYKDMEMSYNAEEV
jgi:hypothetical protein